MSQIPKVGIITVNYKNSKDTKNLLASINRITDKKYQIKTYVVDNGSGDGSMKEIKRAFPGIVGINSPKNLGFAGGNNLGINKAIKDSCDFVLLINNDAEFIKPDTLSKLIGVNRGISAPVVKFFRNSEAVFDYGGRIDKVFGRNTHYESPFEIEDLFPKADYYSGVCLLIDTKVFKKTGLLDDSYFLYYEDVDFCLRAMEQGFKLSLSPDSEILHRLSASTNKLGRKKIKILADSHFNFCLKHLPPMSTPFFLAFNIYLRLKSY